METNKVTPDTQDLVPVDTNIESAKNDESQDNASQSEGVAKQSSREGTPVDEKQSPGNSRRSALERSPSKARQESSPKANDEPPTPLKQTPSKTNTTPMTPPATASPQKNNSCLISKPSYSKHPLKSEEKSIECECKLASTIIFALVAVIVTSYFSSSDTSKPATPENPSIPTTTLSNRLRTAFPNQTKDFHSSILSCYWNSIEKQQDPSILMLISDASTRSNSKCIAEKLLKFIATESERNLARKSDYNQLMLDSTKYASNNSDIVKKLLDDDLVRIFATTGSKVALLSDIQTLPARSMLLFYTYGDDKTTAKYNGIMILLTYELNEVISNDPQKMLQLTSDYSKLSEFVEKKLNEQWSPFIDYDQLQPLYTRIANNVLLANHEASCDQ